ncbi:glyoxylate/hydroxypyruvate reductase A [bacterium]|nr:glyoxylate/hydroxypyruvate reductase A [bacterium]
MAMLLILPGRNPTNIADLLEARLPGADVRIWPETGTREDIDFVVTWNHPEGELGTFPNLKGVMSFGAGVDHILADRSLPAAVPVSRVVDPVLAEDLREYLVGVVIAHRRRFHEYRESQRRMSWEPHRYTRASRVGILGLGRIGSTVARGFAALGFQVSGWSTGDKSLPGVSCHTGPEGLIAITAGADYLICLLPLTPATEGILNYSLFASMKRGSCLINAGRGAHLAEADLLDALDKGMLGAACLDVFREEPLPPDHPFWKRPEIIVTPHVSALTATETVTAQIAENYERIAEGLPMLHPVDRIRGY